MESSHASWPRTKAGLWSALFNDIDRTSDSITLSLDISATVLAETAEQPLTSTCSIFVHST